MSVASVTERGREAEASEAGRRGENARATEARQAIQLVTVAAALGVAWGMKSFYNRASFDSLRWLLDPTVRLAEVLGAGPFELEAHEGWLSRAQAFAVVPACAGMNFLIAAFLSLAAGLAHTRHSVRGALGLALASAAAAYAATVLANALRIAITVHLHVSRWSLGPLTPDRLHELAGVTIYFLALLLLFAAALNVSEKQHATAE